MHGDLANYAQDGFAQTPPNDVTHKGNLQQITTYIKNKFSHYNNLQSCFLSKHYIYINYNLCKITQKYIMLEIPPPTYPINKTT
jgi:hypothetical protein